MKKLASFILAALLILSATAAASAEIDLSALSWDELAALQQQITMEQLGRDEWQEVEIPVGVYKIGEDIPAGKWVLSCTEGSSATCYICEDLSKSGTEYGDGYWDYFYVYNPNNKWYDEGDATEVTVTLSEGMYFIVKNIGSPVIFRPYTGTKLGFK